MRRRTKGDGDQAARTFALSSLAVALLSAAAVPALVGLRVDWASFGGSAEAAAMFLPIIAYADRRGMATVRALVETPLLMVLLSLSVLVLSYCAMRLGRPLADDLLAGADAALGLDPMRLTGWVDRAPAAAALLGFAYVSFGAQLFLLPALLALLGSRARAYGLASGYFLICAIGVGVSTAFPALGAFEHLGMPPGAFDGIDPRFGYHFLHSFHAVRNDPGFTLTAGVASGIVTFPSLHAGGAVLCAWAAWPHRTLRWTFVPLNVAMFASAVTHGAHYAVDTLAGAALAAAVLAAVSRALAPGRPPAAVTGPAGPAAAA